MSGSDLKSSQMAMACYLRDPEGQPAPPGVEQRRLRVYEGLVYNNIEGFISGGFPVLRSLYQEEDWHALVRAFIDGHRCHTPYFLEISQEFLQFLMEVHRPRECDPPFIAELAHYEWVELALDISTEELPPPQSVGELADAVPRLSPLAWSLCYQYPVHRVGPGFQPGEASEPTFLAVYRDREDVVRFMELNATTARLLELVGNNTDRSVRELLADLAGELAMDPETVHAFGCQQFELLFEQSVVLVT